MPVPLHDLPADIILEVVSFLELPDPLSLLLTCSSLYSLSKQRSLWISVLETTRKKSLLACPLHADLSHYTLKGLKGLVVSWLKLHKNWNQPFPEIVQPMTFEPLSEPAEFIFGVQGTDILVLDMRGSVSFWDAKLAAPFPFPAIETGGSISTVSAPSEAPGVCSITILAPQVAVPHTARRYIITIKHEEGKAIGITNEFSEVLDSRVLRYETLFLTEDVVGSVVAIHDQEDCIVTVGSVSGKSRFPDTASVLKLHRSLSTNTELMVCFAYKGHLYSLLEDGVSVQIQHISRQSLCSRHCEESGLYSSEIRSYREFLPFCSIIPSTPFYGVSAVFIRQGSVGDVDEGDHSNSTFISFTFLTNTLPDDMTSSLAFDPLCLTTYVRGTLLMVRMDHSGFNVIVVVQTDIPKLMLVRYHAETRHATTHTLSVPDTVDLLNLHALWIDGPAGAVYLVDRQGLFFTLRYVI
ncbi:F-box domain-containing protein [Mycena venus]|uniref:F-box domain-containing protein n=1 Tax=Mycena venus TaxID=2733690 RepID=A0A8H6YJL8_9AGAR|nr:F-box domain-containing protein [Mycena venus]